MTELPVPLPVYPHEMTLENLRTAELLVVTTLRLFALPWREPGIIHPDWRGGFSAANLAPWTAAAFEYLFDIVVTANRRLLDVRCLHCAHLGFDEARLLQCLSLYQHHQPAEGEAILADWLPPAARRLAAPAAEGVAASFADADFIIPLRNEGMLNAALRLYPNLMPALRLIH